MCKGPGSTKLRVFQKPPGVQLSGAESGVARGCGDDPGQGWGVSTGPLSQRVS